jgi:hypothetical protein
MIGWNVGSGAAISAARASWAAVWIGALAAGCYDSSTASDGGDDTVDAGADARDASPDDGGTGPYATTFVFRFVSDIPESMWLEETDRSMGTGGFWVGVLRDGEEIRTSNSCGICDCDECPSCAVCGAPCPTVVEVTHGGERRASWPGTEWVIRDCPRAAGTQCEAAVASPAGRYVARFCWGTGYDGTPPCPAELTDRHCADVEFDLPAPGGVVAYLLNNGG